MDLVIARFLAAGARSKVVPWASNAGEYWLGLIEQRARDQQIDAFEEDALGSPGRGSIGLKPSLRARSGFVKRDRTPGFMMLVRI
jgi:hypothetical protein